MTSLKKKKRRTLKGKWGKGFIVDEFGVKLSYGNYSGCYLHDSPTEYLKWMVRTYVETRPDERWFGEAMIVHVEEELKNRGEDIEECI